MDEAVKVLVASLTKDVKAAAIPDESKHTADWCVGQLTALYVNYRKTSESRYAEEITRMVRGLLTALDVPKTARTEPLPLVAKITERFRLLHEEHGLPALKLPAPTTPSPRSRKAG